MKRKAHPHEHTGELNIVPYLDIMVNLVMFMLMSLTGFVSFQVINVNMPDLAPPDAMADPSTPPPKPDAAKLTLNVSISPRGFYLAATGGVLPPDVGVSAEKTDDAAPPTIPCKLAGASRDNPCRPDDYNYEALTLKMATIKQSYRDTSSFFLAADPVVKYDIVVRTMDATRGDAAHPLFPDVAFAAVQ